jgi:hypothetical protein
MELEDTGHAKPGECGCGRSIYVYGGISSDTANMENPHTCNSDYITDYWGVWEGQNGPFLRVVHALRSEDVKPAYMKYADTRKAVKNAGGATVRRLTSRALLAYREQKIEPIRDGTYNHRIS